MSFLNSQILNRYTLPTSITLKKEDVNSPFSFKDWFNAHKNIIAGQEYAQYNEYLINWYKEKHTKTLDFSLNLKLKYLSLLRQLQLFLSREETESWYNDIDFNNDKELLLAAPFFAKKLRDISFYYARLRETLKESRLRYNQTGVGFGITSQLQKHLLTEYTKRSSQGPILIPSSFWNSIPELSAIKDSLVIQLEELYDNHSYLDHSPTVALSSYYDLDSKDVENFLITKNLNLSSLSWIYSSGILPPSLSSEQEDVNFYTNLLSQKYIGRNLFTGTLPISSDQKDFYTISLLEGTNFFYWPSYVYNSQAEDLPLYQPQALSSCGIETFATAGSSVDIADTFFVKSARGIEGAWLRSNLYNITSANMAAILESSSETSFRFPFPGFGLSAEDLPWTGFGWSYDKKYRYLEDKIRQSIEDLYWTTSIDVSSIHPLKLQDTTLISSKAQPGKNLNHSDKFRYFSPTPNYQTVSLNEPFQEAWLYKFTETDIPIRTDVNTLIWPYERIDNEQPFPTYYPTNFSDICESLPISFLHAPLALGSLSLSSSDIIYKIQNYQDTIENAAECSWLFESPLEIPEKEIFLNNSTSLQLQVNSKSYVRFIWTGPDYTDADRVFKSIPHSPECLYLSNPLHTHKNFDSCSCRSVLFSPLGHPGEKFSDNETQTDFITEDNQPLEDFDLSTINTSLSTFGWFKTISQTGWGNGKWICGDSSLGNNFYLRKNQKYIYYRAGSKTDELIYPSYTLRYMHPSFTNRIWMRGKKDSEGNWVTTLEPSKMVLSPGDLLIYQRKSSTSYSLSGLVEEIVDLSENRGSVWTNINYLTPSDNKPIIVSYPSVNYSTNPDPQYPKVAFNNILRIEKWSLSSPGLPIQYFTTPSFTFIPTLTGIYTIGLTALSGDPNSLVISTLTGIPSLTGFYESSPNFNFYYTNSGVYIFNDIPAITAVSNISFVPSYSSVETPIPGFVLNTPLKGWDYNISAPNPYALVSDSGAKPFWAQTYYTDNTQFTRYPGLENPQRFFDEHNVITQPEFSQIVLQIGDRIDYIRNYPTRISWIQPITLITSSDENTWCSLEISLSTSNIESVLNSYKEEKNIVATKTPSPIVLTNKIDNEPVEIYYNAINPFVWNITAIPQRNFTTYIEPSTVLSVEAIMPFVNLANENFPTFAVFPTIEDLYSKSQTGGYFIPSNFGASKYLNKKYTLGLNTSSSSLSGYFNETSKLGLTKYLQGSPYEILIEDSSWFKEPINSNVLAGYLNKAVYKTHQKFIPYQSSSEVNSLVQTGIVTPQTLQDPWSEEAEPKWLDSNNHPISFEGELKVSQWTEAQVQFTDLHMDQWVSDIFGNQYGLYKNIDLNATIAEKREAYGQIWVKDNSQKILPAVKALSGIFDTYLETPFIHELTGVGIKKIDVFFDTLMIETSSVLFLEKISYNFSTDQIYSVADDSRRLSLVLVPGNGFILLEPFLSGGNFVEGFLLQENAAGLLLDDLSIGVKFGETWFSPIQKKVVISVAATLEDTIFPELYEIDLEDLSFIKIFPNSSEDITSITSLSSFEFESNGRPLLSYNSLLKEYILVIPYKTKTSLNGFLEFTIDNKETLFLNTIKNFQSLPYEASLPYISQILNTTVPLSGFLNFEILVDNGPVTFSSVSLPSWVTMTPGGILSGFPISIGNVFAEFSITNNFGTSFYSLNIEII